MGSGFINAARDVVRSLTRKERMFMLMAPDGDGLMSL